MNKKINMVFIGTYPEVSKIFMELTERHEGISGRSVDASFERAVEAAVSLEPELDVILSRGGTAEYIQRAVNIPVVYIPITLFDVAKVIHHLPKDTEKIALVHYRQNILNVQELESLYHFRIYEYLFNDYKDIEGSVRDAYEKGVKVIVGGTVAVRIAQKYGIKGFVVSAGTENVARAIEEALQILAEKKKAQEKNAQLSAAFSSMSEGIVILDAERRVVNYNQRMEYIFHRHYKIGDIPGADILDNDCRRIYEAPDDPRKISAIRRIGESSFAVTHTPIRTAGEFAGMVSLYEDVTKIQKLEQQIRRENHAKGFTAKHTFADILGESQAIRSAVRMARIYSNVDSAILIEGESGTGKEFFAQSIHNSSERKNGPFVAVNCTAIPENLLESELFGYEAGAFTGARKEGKQGLFELAHGGTLFLDEIGEISESVQSRLLRVLQEREIMRVGGNKVIPVDVRVISATNRNLWQRSQEGAFRVDLYYRLNVLHLSIPPLRERTGDIRVLSGAFAQRQGFAIDETFTDTILPELERYYWPGNVRELESVIERYRLLRMMWSQYESPDQRLTALLGMPFRAESSEPSPLPVPEGRNLREMVENMERTVVRRVLEECGNDQTEAARRLGIGKTTLWRKLQGKDE